MIAVQAFDKCGSLHLGEQATKSCPNSVATVGLLEWHESVRVGLVHCFFARIFDGTSCYPAQLQQSCHYPNLAELYRTQGRYEKAEPLYERALAIRE